MAGNRSPQLGCGADPRDRQMLFGIALIGGLMWLIILATRTG
jgi:hypothetical protein